MKDKSSWSRCRDRKAQGIRSGTFVEWSCGCTGVLAPSGEKDFIFEDCTAGGYDWRGFMPRIVRTTKCRAKTFEIMEWGEVKRLLEIVSDLVDSGHAHREMRAILNLPMGSKHD